MTDMTVTTASVEETEALGADIAARVNAGELPPFIALFGDLGVGKTAFVRGFTSVLCPNAAVRSPTFTLVNEYRGKDTTVFHFDMYRIEDEDDLYSIGYDDYLERNGICLVEWSENIRFALPPHRTEITIEKCSPDTPDARRVSVVEIKEKPC